MIDMDQPLRLARTRAASWDSGAALELAGRLAGGPVRTVDWDAGAGESWVRLLEGDRPVALVSVTVPVVILEESSAMPDVQLGGALPVVVPTLDAPVLSVSRPVLDEVFGDSSRSEVVDLDSLSANDLWYVTV
jgi:hypothetical protein